MKEKTPKIKIVLYFLLSYIDIISDIFLIKDFFETFLHNDKYRKDQMLILIIIMIYLIFYERYETYLLL